jgi:hypothetical protein
MTNRRKLLISESDRNRIQGLYGIKKQKEFVFDFVLTENNRYLIIMDQVFVSGGDGKTIGSIWEHTYIFNEIINESISKVETISESVKVEINQAISDFVWTKEIVSEWIDDKNVIVEGWLDSFKSLTSKIGQGTMNLVGTVFKQGVIPFLRWVRRMAYTNIGIVLDVVLAILSAKGSAIVWAIIVLLDIYEIITNDFDTQDPLRGEMPYMMLVGDILALAFTGGVGALWKGSVKLITSKGLSKTVPKLIPYLEKLASKIPSLKTSLKSAADTLTKKMGQGGVISKILSGLDNILTKMIEFINRLISKEGLKAAATGTAVLGGVKAIEYGMEKSNAGNYLSNTLKSGEQFAQGKLGKTQFKYDETSNKSIEDKLTQLGYIK